MMMTQISKDVLDSYLENIQEAYKKFPINQVLDVANMLFCLPSKSTIFVVGNGGSALTASHLATDLGVGSLRRRNPLRCISLAENMGVVTATGNDLDFDSIFSKQLELLANRDDVLICISASGNSKNLVNAVQTANEIGVHTVGITGFDGGELIKICETNIHIPTKVGSYGIVEDLHLSICHIIAEIIRAK